MDNEMIAPITAADLIDTPANRKRAESDMFLRAMQRVAQDMFRKAHEKNSGREISFADYTKTFLNEAQTDINAYRTANPDDGYMEAKVDDVMPETEIGDYCRVAADKYKTEALLLGQQIRADGDEHSPLEKRRQECADMAEMLEELAKKLNPALFRLPADDAKDRSTT